MVQFQYVTLAILAAIVLGETLGTVRISGIVAVIVGAAVIATTQRVSIDALSGRTGLGNGIMLFAGVAWGFYALSSRALAGRRSTLQILLPMMVIGIVPIGVAAILASGPSGPWTPRTVALMVALGTLSSGGSFWLSTEGLQRLSAAYAGTITGTTPLIQLFLAFVILGEPLSGWLMLGALFVIGGVLTMALAERKKVRLKAGRFSD
jgi:drug/metabolite transporter (DMT)-like permease